MANLSPAKRKSHSWILVLAGILIGLGGGLLIFFTFGPGQDWLSPESSALSPAVPYVDAPAPDFTLLNLDGEPVHLADLRGRTILLNFWATWCGPCRLEMPLLEEAQARFGERLVVLAVNNDESVPTVRTFIDELDLKLNVLLDPGAVLADMYRVRGLPSTYFIDAQGVLRYQHIGILNQDTLAGYLAELGVVE